MKQTHSRLKFFTNKYIKWMNKILKQSILFQNILIDQLSSNSKRIDLKYNKENDQWFHSPHLQ